MSDQTDLTPKLTAQQSQVESALSRLSLPESQVDHDTLMYRAGWAAAMLESVANTHGTASKPRPVGASVWPVLTISFAASTAACLAVLLWPTAKPDPAVATNTNNHVDRQEEIAHDTQPIQKLPAPPIGTNEEDQLAAPQLTFGSDGKNVGLANLLGLPSSRWYSGRSARLKQFLLEAESPQRFKIPLPDVDLDDDPTPALTPYSFRWRSGISGS